MRAMMNRPKRAFTLLELLVVIAILAIIGGGLLVAYEGLEDNAANAQDSFNINGVSRAVRTFRVINGTFPDGFDSLMVGDTSVPPSVFSGGLLDRLDDDLELRINPTVLAVGETASLNALGITTVSDVHVPGGGIPYTNNNNFTDDSVTVPNRIYDDAAGGPGFYGVARPFFDGAEVAMVDPVLPGGLGPLLGLGPTDRVVALGLGNNSTMSDSANNGALGEVPYSRVGIGEYGRYILLFHVGNGAGPFPEARFIAVLDASGNTLDEAYADFAD